MAEARRYGSLTREDLHLVLNFLPVLERERHELQNRIAENPEKLTELIQPGFAWAHLYELPYPQFLKAFLTVAGLHDLVEQISQRPEPARALHAHLIESDAHEWHGGKDGKFTTGDLIGYVHALIGNLDCLLIYGRYLNDLIDLARQGDVDALLDAIRIDPSVVTTTLVRNWLSASVITGEREFVDEIRKAMAGRTGRQASYLKQFRALMQLLHEAGALGLPTREIESLALDLGVYVNNPGAGKNVSELIRKAKRLKGNAISK